MKKQSMDWSYLNGILRRWHEKGLHTAEAVRAGDRDPKAIRAGGQPQRPEPAGEERRAREDMDRMRRLMEQMKREDRFDEAGLRCRRAAHLLCCKKGRLIYV